MLLYVGGSPQGHRSSPSPVCQQAKFLLSDSGESDSPAGNVPPSWAMYRSGTQQILQCGISWTHGAWVLNWMSSPQRTRGYNMNAFHLDNKKAHILFLLYQIWSQWLREAEIRLVSASCEEEIHLVMNSKLSSQIFTCTIFCPFVALSNSKVLRWKCSQFCLVLFVKKKGVHISGTFKIKHPFQIL